MNDVFFRNVTNIGDLRLEHIFFEFEYEPILFTCVDNTGKTYLCICSEMRYYQKWVLSECSLLSLAAMIDGKIDIASTFCKATELITIVSDVDGQETIQVISPHEIDPLDLPQSGTFLQPEMGNHLHYLQSKLQSPNYHTLKVTPNLQDYIIIYGHETNSVSGNVPSQKEHNILSCSSKISINTELFTSSSTEHLRWELDSQNTYASFISDILRDCPAHKAIVLAA